MSHPVSKPGIRPWRTAFLAGMASYLDAGAIVTTSTALVLYAPALGLNEWDFGALSALLTLCFATGALFGGRLGDKFGRRRVFTSTLLLFAAGIAVLTFAVSAPMLYVGVVIVGFAIGADLPVSLALAAEEAPEGAKGRMVALSGVLWMVGIGVVVVLSIIVGAYGELGARLLYAQLLVVSLVVLVLRSRMKESTEWTTARSAAIAAPASERVDLSTLRRLLARPLFAPLLATGLFYSVWNLGANTIGQFSTYLYVNVAGSDVPTASAIGLLGIPIGLVSGLVFMRIVDRPSRQIWFAAGVAFSSIGFAVPLVLGVSVPTLATMGIVGGFGIGLAGETIYKVWTQELFPTLVRSTAQGATIAFTRYVAAAFALFTPIIATTNVTALFGILIASSVVSGLIGIFWIPRLPKAKTPETGTGASRAEGLVPAAIDQENNA
ncbi:MFS transporter [Arthrobacter sp. 18067]|uniref:MFS transporter n=1 Tax=Arthrobacter sp. 18067 TaxID=2681413 RepID=UPI001357E4BB|nr:MFS transporter [Arthrobacter sp. 18067]